VPPKDVGMIATDAVGQDISLPLAEQAVLREESHEFDLQQWEAGVLQFCMEEAVIKAIKLNVGYVWI